MEHDVNVHCELGEKFDAQLFVDLLKGDDVQKISVVHSLPQLISIDSSAVFTRIIPKIKQDLGTSSCEFQIATSATFMVLLQRTVNTSILQAILFGIESKDPNVSFAWSEALYGAMGSLPELMIQTHVLPLAKQKFQPNSSVFAKMFCAKLIGEICTCVKFHVLDVKRDIMPIVIGLCQDGHPDVRAQMCAVLPRVASVLGNDWEKTNLLSCIVDLAQDENLNVRSTSIVAIRSMIKVLSPEVTKNTLLPLIKRLCFRACEESLVTAMILSDEFGAIMHDLPPLADQDVLFFMRIYKQLSVKGKQNSSKANASVEVTIRQRCATNTYGIMKLVMESLPGQIHDVYTTFRDHAIDPCYLVRRAAAGALSQIAQLLGNENKMMKNEIVRLLRDDAVEVLDAIVPTITALFTNLTKSGLLTLAEASQTTTEFGKALVKCQNELSKRYNWRLSIEFIKQLEVLPTCMPSEFIHNNFTPTLFEKLIYGKAKPIRSQAARTLVVFMRFNFKPNQTKWIRESLIRQTAQSRSCHSRILYFYVCEAVLSIYSEMYFKQWFLTPCLQLADDRIANVRWKFMQFSSKLKSMVTLATDVATKQLILQSVSRLEAHEKSKIVLDMIRIKKREPMPKYSADALREEEIRIREEATTNIDRQASPRKLQGAQVTATTTSALVDPEMRFLEQHFYIDAGVKLESILGLECSQTVETDKHLNPVDLISIEACNITDDAKVNLRNNIKGISKLMLPTKFDSGAGGDTRTKRYSSIISTSCLDLSKTSERVTERRRSLNLNLYSVSKIPVPNRSKLKLNKALTKENEIDNKNVNVNKTNSIKCLPERLVAESRHNRPTPAGRGRKAPAPSRSSPSRRST